MISKELIKELIYTNEEFITNNIKVIIERENVVMPPSLRKVGIIYGVRRSGKSFILYSIFKKNIGKSLYIDFEDERLKNIDASSLDNIRECFFELKPHLLKTDGVFFLFDEIQKIQEWERFCRRLVEKERINLWVAGSSSKITPRGIQTSLRGRAWSIQLFPFSFAEFLKAHNVVLEEAVHGRNRIVTKNYLTQYLKWGGFPEITMADSDFVKNKVLKEYMDAMFFKDLTERFNITNIVLLETLKENLFTSFSAKFSLTSFYKNYHPKFPFSKDTLFSYYRYFLESMLVFETRLLSSSAYQRMRNLPKIYLVDTGLCRKVSTVDNGRLLENVVFLHLKRQDNEIFYFNESGECDFIVKEDGKFTALQVTFELGAQNRVRELKGLVNACKTLGLKTGFLITFDQEETVKIENIKIEILPFWKWLVLK